MHLLATTGVCNTEMFISGQIRGRNEEMGTPISYVVAHRARAAATTTKQQQQQ